MGVARKATLKAAESKPVKVRYAGREIEFQAKAGQSYQFGPTLLALRP